MQEWNNTFSQSPVYWTVFSKIFQPQTNNWDTVSMCLCSKISKCHLSKLDTQSYLPGSTAAQDQCFCSCFCSRHWRRGNSFNRCTGSQLCLSQWHQSLGPRAVIRNEHGQGHQPSMSCSPRLPYKGKPDRNPVNVGDKPWVLRDHVVNVQVEEQQIGGFNLSEKNWGFKGLDYTHGSSPQE